MKRIYLLFILAFFYTNLDSQNRINDFYSLISSSNVLGQNLILTFIKTDDCIIEKAENQKNRFPKIWRDYWKQVAIQIDSLNFIDYKQDTLFIFQMFNGVNPYEPFTMIINNRDRIVAGYGSVKRLDDAEGWPFYYDTFHPVLINAVLKWDMPDLKEVTSKYGTKPGEISGTEWVSIERIIIRDHRKIAKSVIELDGISFLFLRNTNHILY